MAVSFSPAHPVTLAHFCRILVGNESITISPEALQTVRDSYDFLTDFATDKLIYGINTGFGPMAQYKIDDRAQRELQYNLIRSHCSGMGNPIEPVQTKALMIARLSTLLKGYSGVHPETVLLLQDLINYNVIPVVYEHGSVGASGDLVQLAHLALCLIGEGKVWEGDRHVPAADAYARHNLKPMRIHLREGLALMNGTSAMTGIGMMNLLNAQNLMGWSIAASSLLVELVESYDDHYSKELNGVKWHRGQQKVAQQMRNFLADSRLVRKRSAHLYDKKVTDWVLTEKVQEYYSIRCVPQILGPVADVLAVATEVLTNEVNSVNDNPVVDHRRKDVFHGGNFHGDYVSLEMDKLKISMTRLSMLAERQLNFLLNDKLNQRLPPFVNLGTLGLNLGMQGAQFVATSTVAENQTYSFPMYVHSIPSNNDNQDIVSMGTNAALLTAKVIENTSQVLAVEWLTILQAVDYLGCRDKLASPSRRIYDQLRALVPVFDTDQIIGEKLARIKQFITKHPVDFTRPEAASPDEANETLPLTSLAV